MIIRGSVFGGRFGIFGRIFAARKAEAQPASDSGVLDGLDDDVEAERLTRALEDDNAAYMRARRRTAQADAVIPCTGTHYHLPQHSARLLCALARPRDQHVAAGVARPVAIASPSPHGARPVLAWPRATKGVGIQCTTRIGGRMMVIEVSNEQIDTAEVLASREADCNHAECSYIRVLRLADGRTVAAISQGCDPEYVEVGVDDRPEDVIADVVRSIIQDACSYTDPWAATEVAAMWGEIEDAAEGDEECYIIGETPMYGGWMSRRVVDPEGFHTPPVLTYSEAVEAVAALEAEQLRPYGCPMVAYGAAGRELYRIVRAV